MELTDLAIKIVGLTPLVMHSSRGMQQSAGGATRKKIPTPKDEAEAGAYRLPNGDLYIPSDGFIGGMRKVGTSLRLTIEKTPIRNVLAASVFLESPEIPLYHPKTKKPIREYEIYTCRAVVQRQGIMRSRPRIREWAATIKLSYDNELIAPTVIRDLLTRAGKVVGIGDQRPGAPLTPGPYGRYEVLPE